MLKLHFFDPLWIDFVAAKMDDSEKKFIDLLGQSDESCQGTPIFAGLDDTYLRRAMTQVHRDRSSGLRNTAPLLSLQGWGLAA